MMKTKFINRITVIGCWLLAIGMTSCSDYLEIYPENVEPTDKYWASKADVESTLMAGYYYLRQSVESYLIPWGELRAGCIYSRRGSALQQFQVKPETKTVTSWAPMYQIISTANLVLANAEKARGNDQTYTENEMRSHYCEAYWLRALAYFYIVRNWRDAPLITEPFETDAVSYRVGKNTEAELIAQIKSDLLAAIELDAAKENFNTTWETKGRATKWAIYALMADVCLWNKDFDQAVSYANALLNSSSNNAPRFMTTATHSSWFSIFNPGNSNESIFEVQWSHEKLDGSSYQTNNLYTLFDNTADGTYLYSQDMIQNFQDDYRTITEIYGFMDPEVAVRTQNGGYVGDATGSNGYCWKYIGSTTLTDKRTQSFRDANFIIYRIADVMLIKAEALLMKSMGTNPDEMRQCVELLNQVRRRTNLPEITVSDDTDFRTVLNAVLYERLMELAGEGKAWYDLLRLGRYTDPSGIINFKKEFFIDNVVRYNNQANESWIRAVLSDENAWYLPVNADEIKTNDLILQNPYYM